MFTDCIILAGGSGTRLWPASTSSRPKQFLRVPSSGRRTNRGGSFFYTAIERALAVTGDSDDGRVIIVAGKNNTDLIIEECSGFDAKDRKRLVLIPEPLAKNTAPAIACALVYIDRVSGGRERNILVLTSDHIIRPPGLFKADAKSAAAIARKDRLVVFGIPPLKPETGYGYIEAALTIPVEEKVKNRKYKSEVFSVASFREKPDIKKAKEFVASGKFYWNSGMFAFSSKFMLSEFLRCSPETAAPFYKLEAPSKQSFLTRKGLRILKKWDTMETAYRKAKAISFDYAVAEKCRSTAMVKAGFSWTDVGSWDEYARLPGHTQSKVYGSSEAKETCFVDSDIPVALCGTEDLIVVVRSGRNGGPAAVLVAKKGETQRLREIVAEIKATGDGELL